MYSAPHNATYYRDTANSILQQDYYRRYAEEQNPSNILNLFRDFIVNAIEYIIFKMLIPMLNFIAELFGYLPLSAQDGSMYNTTTTILYYAILVLLVSVFFLAVYICYQRIKYSIAENRRDAYFKLDSNKQLNKSAILTKKAFLASEQQEYALAIRLLFQSGIAHLQVLLSRRSLVCLTNKEYLHYFSRTPAIEHLTVLTSLMDHWYKGVEMTAADFAAAVKAHKQLMHTTAADYQNFLDIRHV